MEIEHVGYIVHEPPAVARWYVQHLGFSVKRRVTGPPYTHFLADGSGRVMIEIYNNPAASVPDYRAMDPLVLHLAFSVEDVEAARTRLLEAGATSAGPVTTTPDGDRLAMLRDPWGMPIQLVRRAEPMV
ncbi:MAG TPA: VOC family protein [Planctomycetaceae bacterium]|nr:VOC family protein [Planctomycetaceae bacterium]HIQ22463.1 VOC family protein [Planctomycetota bacterium]